MLHCFHPGRVLLLATLLHGAAPTTPASASSLRVWPGATGATSLEALWSRPATWETVPLAASAVASKPAANALLNSASKAPFAARLARIEATRHPVDPAAVLAQGDALRARLSQLRSAAPSASPSSSKSALSSSPTSLFRQTDVRIVRHEGRALFMTGDDLGRAASAPRQAAALDVAVAAAEGFWQRWASALALAAPADELQLLATQTDALGQTHLRYQQVYRGLEVWACDAWVHVQDGNVIAFNGRLAPTPRGLDVAPRFAAAAARPTACAAVEATARGTTAEPRVAASASATDLVVFPRDGQPVLAWKVRVQAGLDVVEDVFVDAQSGTVLHSTSLVASDGPVSGSGNDLFGNNRALDLYQVGADYFNINAAKPMWNPASNPPQVVKGGIRVLDARNGGEGNLYFSVSNNPNNWTGKANQVSAAANASIVYDYYNSRHGRNSIDGAGGTMELVVNFKSNFNNAFWNGQLMVFGNGDGNAFSDLAAALDATGHEMSHGVVERTANLVYEFQSGALNESFADVFGTAAEFFANPGTANFLIGESITTPGTAGDALRNLEDPGAPNVAFGGQQPGNMSQYRDLPISEDKGGVHINSGIPNRAFHLVATSTALGATAVERMGKAERIYYRALTLYLTRSAQFIDCRLAVIRAAEDLYGAGGAVAQACAQAFDAVGISTGQPSEPPPTLPPVEGEEWLTATDSGSGRLVRFKPDLSTVENVSSVGVVNKPTLTDDGQTMVFVDAAHQLRAANSNGTGEHVISTQPVWWNVSLAPDGSSLAATTTAFDGRIYIFDLDTPANDRMFVIKSQNYGGEGDNAALFADVLDYSNDGHYVMYDAFNIAVLAAGDTLSYWDINVMRAEDGDITRVFPPQPPGISIGNPTFSPVSDFVIAFDYLDETNNVRVLAADLEHGAIGLVTNNFLSTGRPTFAPDAKTMAYHYIDTSGPSIWTVSLAADGITGTGNDRSIATGGFDPFWYAIGSRTPVVLSNLSAKRGGEGVVVEWEATLDTEFRAFVVLRDLGNGFVARSGELTEPARRQGEASLWRFEDSLADIGAAARVRYAILSLDRHGEKQLLGTVWFDPSATENVPRPVRLYPNVPNPFNPGTRIVFELGRRQRVSLSIFDAAGRSIGTLWSGVAEPGPHTHTWDGHDGHGGAVPSGIYFARLLSEEGTHLQKMTLLR